MRTREERIRARRKRRRREEELYRYYSHPICPVDLKNDSVKLALARWLEACRDDTPDKYDLYLEYQQEYERVYGKLENCHFTRRSGENPKDFKKETSGRMRAAMRNLSEDSDVPTNENQDRKRRLDWAWSID